MKTITPEERVNLTYRHQEGDHEVERELPLHLLVISDLSGSSSVESTDSRVPVVVNQENLDRVLASHDVQLALKVSSALAKPGEDLDVRLKFEKVTDFNPDGILRQIPAAKELIELRAALLALKAVKKHR